MRFTRATLAVVFSAMLLASSAFASRAHRVPTGARTRSLHKTAAKSHRMHGQQSIEPARVTEIQQALIREHYLTAEANGQWDATTEAAMHKYQADQGWQTKLVPDSRAIKKLGLGPDYSSAINAKESSFAAPTSSGTTSSAQSTDFAVAAGVSH